MKENLELKAMALLLALLLWFNLGPAGEGEVAVAVPVTVDNIAPALQVETAVPASVEFSIGGPRLLLWQLDKHPPALRLDAGGGREGGIAFGSLEKSLSLPRGLHVIRTAPATVTVTLRRAPSPSTR